MSRYIYDIPNVADKDMERWQGHRSFGPDHGRGAGGASRGARMYESGCEGQVLGKARRMVLAHAPMEDTLQKNGESIVINYTTGENANIILAPASKDCQSST